MKIAVISDIHGNLAALQAVLEDIERERVDQVVNLGDLLSGPLQPAKTADLLMAKDFVTIAGNHERQLLQAWDGPSESRSPLGPRCTASDMTSDSRSGSMGGFVTCAKRCRK